jgi:hypothetical protein
MQSLPFLIRALDSCKIIKERVLPLLENRIVTSIEGEPEDDHERQKLKDFFSRYPIQAKLIENVRVDFECIKIVVNIIHEFLRQLNEYFSFNPNPEESNDESFDHHTMFRILTNDIPRREFDPGIVQVITDEYANLLLHQFRTRLDDLQAMTITCHNNSQDQSILNQIKRQLNTEELFELVPISRYFQSICEGFKTLVDQLPKNLIGTMEGLNPTQTLKTMFLAMTAVNYHQVLINKDNAYEHLVYFRSTHDPDNASNLDYNIKYLNPNDQCEEQELRDRLKEADSIFKDLKDFAKRVGFTENFWSDLRKVGFDILKMAALWGVQNTTIDPTMESWGKSFRNDENSSSGISEY